MFPDPSPLQTFRVELFAVSRGGGQLARQEVDPVRTRHELARLSHEQADSRNSSLKLS